MNGILTVLPTIIGIGCTTELIASLCFILLFFIILLRLGQNCLLFVSLPVFFGVCEGDDSIFMKKPASFLQSHFEQQYLVVYLTKSTRSNIVFLLQS